jgi:hypothetical protein
MADPEIVITMPTLGRWRWVEHGGPGDGSMVRDLPTLDAALASAGTLRPGIPVRVPDAHRDSHPSPGVHE